MKILRKSQLDKFVERCINKGVVSFFEIKIYEKTDKLTQIDSMRFDYKKVVESHFSLGGNNLSYFYEKAKEENKDCEILMHNHWDGMKKNKKLIENIDSIRDMVAEYYKKNYPDSYNISYKEDHERILKEFRDLKNL